MSPGSPQAFEGSTPFVWSALSLPLTSANSCLSFKILFKFHFLSQTLDSQTRSDVQDTHLQRTLAFFLQALITTVIKYLLTCRLLKTVRLLLCICSNSQSKNSLLSETFHDTSPYFTQQTPSHHCTNDSYYFQSPHNMLLRVNPLPTIAHFGPIQP